MSGSPFDRVRPRHEDDSPQRGLDPQGTRALFSAGPDQPAPGSVVVACGSCRQTSVLSLTQALRLALPSLYLPVLRGRHPWWARCPSCGRRCWLSVRIQL